MDDDARPLLLTPEMRVRPGEGASEPELRASRRAERLAELQAIVGPMPPLAPAVEPPAGADEFGLRPAPAPPERALAAGGERSPAVPDEPALRAMLREIVEDELAGEAGERITRHLRRLVRAEVEFALARRELDRERRG